MIAVERVDTEVSAGVSPRATVHYTVLDASDYATAVAMLLAESQAQFDPWGTGQLSIPRTNVSVRAVSDGAWAGVVEYGPVRVTGESETEFDTGGATRHVRLALSQQTFSPVGGAAPNAHGLIGNNGTGVEGVEIVAPSFRFSQRHWKPKTFVTPAYLIMLRDLTGRVNDAPFFGHAAGEVLFLGASGRMRQFTDWEIEFRFAANANGTASIAGFPVIPVGGHQYLWTRSADDVEGDQLTQRIIGAYVATVYQSAPFGALQIGA